MIWWKKKKKKPGLTLREQRANVRDAIKRAMTNKEFEKVENLEDLLEHLEKKIRRKHGIEKKGHSDSCDNGLSSI